MILSSIGLVCLVFLLIYLYFKMCYQYFKNRNLPYIKPIVFPFGNWKENIMMKKSMGVVCADMYKDYKHLPAIGNYQFNRAFLTIHHPEMIKQCLIRDFTSFHDRGFEMNEEIDPLAGHLFFLEGIKWRNLRNKLSPTFTSGKIKNMFPILEQKTNHLIKHLHQYDGKEIEVKELFTRLLTDIIGTCAFGIECNTIDNPDSEFREWGKKALEPNFRAILVSWLNAIARPIREYFKFKILPPEMTDFFVNMVKDTITYREENNVKVSDFMQMLIQLKNNQSLDGDGIIKKTEKGHSLSIEECAAQAFVFFIAGFETSSTTMSYAIYELAKNPEIQEKVQENIDSVFEKHSQLSYEAMSELTYLDNVINETLRKHPPVPVLNRVVSKPVDMKWGDEDKTVHLEKDLKIIIPVLGLHYDPKYYPNPERFDPDRFTEENKSQRPHYVHLPFGEGPRNCIGARFGFLQTKVGLALLLKNYTFKISLNSPLNLTFKAYSFIHIANEKMYFTIEKRF